jgi:hypothetical protein
VALTCDVVQGWMWRTTRQCHHWQGWMWTTSHVNATTDKDGCGQQHPFLSVVLTCVVVHIHPCQWWYWHMCCPHPSLSVMALTYVIQIHPCQWWH